MSSDQIKVRVQSVKQVAPMIREFSFKAQSGDLFPFSPGSHVVVEMQGPEKTYRNAYSLISDPNHPAEYKIAVRLEDESRGGSVFMHQQVQPGDELLISPPANLFSPDWRAKKHVLIAGGVGITPFMSYLPELKRRKANFELHYLFRSKQTGAYKESLAEDLGDQFFSYDADSSKRCNVTNILTGCSLGTHIYVCGPQKLIQAVQSTAEEMGWPKGVIHVEEFAAPKPGKAFTVELKSTHAVIEVSETESLLEALEAADIEVPHLCRGGVCGRCLTGVTEGQVEHRDGFLSAEEKAGNDCIMPCVSRAKSDRLVLDI
jgi:ferredoxin-NADP reductase